MRALIVDDEPVARQILREELELLNSEIVGEAENGESALLQILSLKPDVVFLDIQMPVMGGFEMLSHLAERGQATQPAIVMVTAYDQHAIKAFEAGAIDYLLKPASKQRIALALARAARTLERPGQAASKITALQEFGPRLKEEAKARKVVGKLGGEFFLLNVKEVLAFQADGDLTWIVTAKQKFLAMQNLRALEMRLGDSNFRRIHRNALVNVEQIRKMSTITSQRWLLTLNNGQEFVVSKRQAKNVRQVLNW